MTLLILDENEDAIDAGIAEVGEVMLEKIEHNDLQNVIDVVVGLELLEVLEQLVLEDEDDDELHSDDEVLQLEVMLLDVTDDVDEEVLTDELLVELLLENEVVDDEVDMVIAVEVDDEIEVTDYMYHITLHILDEIEVMDETDT